METLSALISGIFNLHRAEAYRVRASIIYGIIAPFFLIVLAAFIGAWSWNLKAGFLTVVMVCEAGFLLWLGIQRIFLGTELEWFFGGAEFSRDAVVDAAESYVRLVAALVASEIAACFIVLLIPAHTNPVLALLLVPATICLVTYAIWIGGVTRWPDIVYWMALGTFLVVVPTLWFQYLLGHTPETISAIPPAISRVAVAGTPIDASVPGAWDHAGAWRIGSMSAGQVAFNAIFVLLFAATTLSRLTGIHAIRRGTLSFLAFVLVMVLANWLFWRGGIDDVRKAVDEVSARSAAAAAPRTISLDWCNDRVRRAMERGDPGEVCPFDLAPGEEAGSLEIPTNGWWDLCSRPSGVGSHWVSCLKADMTRFEGHWRGEGVVCSGDLRLRTTVPRRYNFVVRFGAGISSSVCGTHKII